MVGGRPVGGCVVGLYPFGRTVVWWSRRSAGGCVTESTNVAVPQNVDILKDQEAVKQLANILKTNVRSCTAVGHPFVIQLGRIYLDMLNVYKVSVQLRSRLVMGRSQLSSYAMV